MPLEQYYRSCDCEDICECTIDKSSQCDEEILESPFPDNITQYILSRKPSIVLYNVLSPREDMCDDTFTSLTTHDGQARELTIEPISSEFYINALDYINQVYGVEPDEDVECVCWESQISIS